MLFGAGNESSSYLANYAIFQWQIGNGNNENPCTVIFSARNWFNCKQRIYISFSLIHPITHIYNDKINRLCILKYANNKKKPFSHIMKMHLQGIAFLKVQMSKSH